MLFWTHFFIFFTEPSIMPKYQSNKSLYERYGLITNDAALMELAIQVEGIFSLIRKNELSEYQSIIEKNPSFLYATNNLRQTALHIACQCDRKEILDFILTKLPQDLKAFALNSMIVLSKFNPDINKKAIHKTPLMVALENGCQAVASYLLEQPEIDLTLRDGSGHLAYHYARHFRAPKGMVNQIKTMTEKQFKEKYPKIVSSKGIKAILSNEHVKS